MDSDASVIGGENFSKLGGPAPVVLCWRATDRVVGAVVVGVRAQVRGV